METISQRIKYFLFLKKKRHVEMAHLLNINVQQFNNWCNNTKPSIEGVIKLIEYFPDLSARWLLTGKGEPTLSESIFVSQAKLGNGEIGDDMQKFVEDLDYAIREFRKTNPLRDNYYSERLQKERNFE